MRRGPIAVDDLRVEQSDGADARRWRARPVLAALVLCALYAVPFLASTATVLLLAKIDPAAGHRWLTYLLIGATAIGVSVSVERSLRRLLPVATLLRLTMLFPDRAPSRFRVARAAAGSTRRMAAGSVAGDAARDALTLIARLGAHDRRTRGHSERVRVFTDMLAEELKLPQADRDRLRWASLLHDIGKLAVPTTLLNKPAKLDSREFAVMRTHPEVGAELTAALLPWLGEWGRGIVEHHEKYDGKGYPAGLAGLAISPAGRIIGLVDAFETMTAARAYKKPMATRAARMELARCAGQHFDPTYVRAFLGVSLPRLLWAMGPLSFLLQLPFLRSLAQAGAGSVRAGELATTVAGAAVAAGVGVTSAYAAVPARPAPAPATFTAAAETPALQVQGPQRRRVAAAPAAVLPAPTPQEPVVEPVVGPVAPSAPEAGPVPPTDPAPPVLGPVAPSPILEPPLVGPVAPPPVEPPLLDPVVPPVAPTPAAPPAAPVAPTPAAPTGAPVASSPVPTLGPVVQVDPPSPLPTLGPVVPPSSPVPLPTLGPVVPTAAPSQAPVVPTTAPSPAPSSLATPAPSPSTPFTVARPLPSLTLTGLPSGSTYATAVTAQLTTDDPQASLACSLDGAAAVPCGPTWSLSQLAPGTHTVTASATNVQTGSTSRTATFMVLAVPTVQVEPANVSGSTATVRFVLTDATGAECSLDGGAWTPCASGLTFPGLLDGLHRVDVRPLGPAGPGDPGTTGAFRIAALLQGPHGVVTRKQQTLQIAPVAGALAYQCQVDGGAWTLCANPSNETFPLGPHTVLLRAVTAAGPQPASGSAFTVVDDAVTFISTPPAFTTGTTATFAFSAAPGLRFRCALDNDPYTDCASGVVLTGLTPGRYRFKVVSVDDAGDVGSPLGYTWRVR
jgi:putative nucleotidyltransferase with HDIG domain